MPQNDFGFADVVNPGKSDLSTDISSSNPDAEVLEVQEREREAAVERFTDDTLHRKKLVCWIKVLIPVYLSCIGVILFIVGIYDFQIALFSSAISLKFGFILSDTVLVALLGTTTANVIGLAAIVLRGLFK